KKKNISRILSNQEIINQITYPNPKTAEDNKEGNEEDDSIELPQDLSDVAYTEHNTALSKLFKL
ncbi:26625_t:CDS:2, partial [Racocetra persica]